MLNTEFSIGDTLKFSSGGLSVWLAGRRSFYEPNRYKKWRWRIVGFDKSTSSVFLILILERIDSLSPQKGKWASILFEKVT